MTKKDISFLPADCSHSPLYTDIKHKEEDVAPAYSSIGNPKTPSVDDVQGPSHTQRPRKRPYILFNLLLLSLLFLILKSYYFHTSSTKCADCGALMYNPPSRLKPDNPLSRGSNQHPKLPFTKSRETIIDVSSDSIRGTYELYDLLSIHTQSGSIDISVNLHNASASAPKPAILRLSSASGSIRVRAGSIGSSFFDKIPQREYQTQVQSQSGSLHITAIHGTHTSLKTQSGGIMASLYPHCSNSTFSAISTSSASGHADITVHPFMNDPSAPLRNMNAEYSYGSGSMNIRYPSTWEGTIQGRTSSGSITVDWEGLKIVKNHIGAGQREIEAYKGDGKGTLKFRGRSGSMHLLGDSDAWAA